MKCFRLICATTLMRANFPLKDCTKRLCPRPMKRRSIVKCTLKERMCSADCLGGFKRRLEDHAMFGTRRIQAIAIIAIVSLGLLPVTLRAQKDGKNKEPKPIPADAHAVLWQEPTDITSRDLLLGF